MLIYNSSSKRKVEKNVETESKQSSGPSKKLLLFNVTFSELQVSGSSFFLISFRHCHKGSSIKVLLGSGFCTCQGF